MKQFLPSPDLAYNHTLHAWWENAFTDEEIEAIFGNEESTQDGQEKRISFTEYLDKITKRAIDQRKKKEEEKKALKTTLKKE